MRKGLILFLVLVFPCLCFAQEDSMGVEKKKKWHQRSLVKAAIVPVVLFGYGASTIQNHGLYSSYQAQRDIQKHFSGFKTQIDDYLVFVPYAELVALNLLKIRCKNDFLNTGILIVKSELLMIALVYPMKYLVHLERPDQSGFNSFPSGHTAEAFLAATIIHKEYQHKSLWPGLAAYAVATSVGVLRMLNNVHWQSDVFAGAGIGILSAQIAYLTHRHRYHWSLGRNSCLVPTYRNGNVGFYYGLSF